ncbi:MAG: 5-(carboxyamino)imidazole ribonucleotide mutase [Acidobacteria bacterium]|nr:5-(carboxyamino)imidazole ribonucleotide mutase [Acidobacteriota bacterium]MBU4495205.1 5-(carboxyamino)imidazole ribonucleotide mutase [Acidobacteriota bacterium]
MMDVAIFMGSDSDFDIAKAAISLFKEFGVPFGVEVTSAHRTPERTVQLVRHYEEQGVKLFLTLAGKAAHLGGVVAAHTVRPVIGIPVGGTALAGMDALFSTVQMPKGIPVACMGLGKSGAANAALLSIAILALNDDALGQKLKDYRRSMAAEVERASQGIKEIL